MTLNYDGLISPLILAAQQLSASSTALQTSLSVLQNQVSNLQGSLETNASTSALTVYSPGNFSGDSVGQAEILTGQTSVRVTFSQAYQYQPIITATPIGDAALQDGFRFTLEDIDASGFTIETQLPVTSDTTFDWHSFASPTEQLTVSDGNSTPIPLVLPVQTQSSPIANLPVVSDPQATTTPASNNGSVSSTPDSNSGQSVAPVSTSSSSPAVLGTSTAATTAPVPTLSTEPAAASDPSSGPTTTASSQ